MQPYPSIPQDCNEFCDTEPPFTNSDEPQEQDCSRNLRGHAMNQHVQNTAQPFRKPKRHSDHSALEIFREVSVRMCPNKPVLTSCTQHGCRWLQHAYSPHLGLDRKMKPSSARSPSSQPASSTSSPLPPAGAGQTEHIRHCNCPDLPEIRLAECPRDLAELLKVQIHVEERFHSIPHFSIQQLTRGAGKLLGSMSNLLLYCHV